MFDRKFGISTLEITPHNKTNISMSQRHDQFYSIAKQVVSVLCPGKKYESITLLSNAKGIQVKSDDADQTAYNISFKSNTIYVHVLQGPDQKLKSELSWKLGSVSIKEIVDKVREKTSTNSAFGNLLLKKLNRVE